MVVHGLGRCDFYFLFGPDCGALLRFVFKNVTRVHRLIKCNVNVLSCISNVTTSQ